MGDMLRERREMSQNDFFQTEGEVYMMNSDHSEPWATLVESKSKKKNRPINAHNRLRLKFESVRYWLCSMRT